MASSTPDTTDSAKAATFDEGVLKISQVRFDGNSYLLAMTDSGSNIFTVSREIGEDPEISPEILAA